MSKLVKLLQNGTDFDICIFLLNSGKYAVTIWDMVNRTHEKQDIFDSYGQALLKAKELNNSYKIDENVVKLTESDIQYMVTEAVNKMLKEGFFDFNNVVEKKKEDGNDDGHKVSDEKKTRIISILQQDEVDKAPYAYRLWPDKDEDSARSYFYKCLNQEENDDGIPYSFSDKEFNKLYSMLSNMKSI